MEVFSGKAEERGRTPGEALCEGRGHVATRRCHDVLYVQPLQGRKRKCGGRPPTSGEAERDEGRPRERRPGQYQAVEVEGGQERVAGRGAQRRPLGGPGE